MASVPMEVLQSIIAARNIPILSPAVLKTTSSRTLAAFRKSHANVFLGPIWRVIDALLSGEIFTNIRCESVETPICPKSFSWKGDKCLRIVEEHCEPGYILKDGQCVSSAIPDCGNLIFNGKAYIGGQPRCPEGSYLEGESCLSPVDPRCPQGFKFNGNKCRSEKAPQCPSSTVYDKSSQDCVSVVKPTCPGNDMFNGKHCAVCTGDCMNFQFCPTESYGKGCQLTRNGIVCSGPQEQPKPAPMYKFPTTGDEPYPIPVA